MSPLIPMAIAMSDEITRGLSAKQIATERAQILARLEYLDGYDRMHAAPKGHVCDGVDHSACKAKVRKGGYWHHSVKGRAWVDDRSSRECKHDRRFVNPACVGCPHMGDADAA